LRTFDRIHSLAAGSLIALIATASLAAPNLGDCTSIDHDEERLRCYDAASGRTPAPAAEAPGLRLPSRDSTRSGSIWERRIVADAEREPFTLTALRPSYFLFTRMSSPNSAPFRSLDPGARVTHSEMKLQLSMQTKVADNVFGNNGDIWLAYTQVAYWQVFNEEFSSPFRDTNHEPEAYISFLMNRELPGFNLRNINLGLVHQSNGQSRPLSRSWDRVYADFNLVRGPWIATFRPWLRIKESSATDDNPDIENYTGRYELRLGYERNRHIYGVMLRNVFNRDGRYGLEASWSFPIAGRLRGLVQMYSGYGETLIDYNHKNNRIGVGILMSDWL
jgi:phospholipase A1